MFNTAGNLFNVFDSRVFISDSAIFDVTPSQLFIYMSNSYASLGSVVIANMAFNDVGGLATLFSRSSLQLNSVSITNISSSEHGVISLKKSTLRISSSNVTDFNMSLIAGLQSRVFITESEIRDGRIPLANRSLSMVPSGGVVSCVDCSEVAIVSSTVERVSAKEGAVVFASSTEAFRAGTVTLSQSLFRYCAAKTLGGVVSVSGSSLDIINCTFHHNSASSGAVVNYETVHYVSRIVDSWFEWNIAEFEGGCVRWVNSRPSMENSTFANNSAQYGPIESSVPRTIGLLDPLSLEPVSALTVLGVTGQTMEKPLVVGIFDAVGQLIVTDTSTLVSLSFPTSIEASGTTDVRVQQGVAEFSLLFSPFSTTPVNLTFSSDGSGVEDLVVTYAFRDCEPGEIRTPDGCFPCQKNSFSYNTSAAACESCPSHTECHGRIDVRLEAGYWRSSNLTASIYECLSADACLGGVNSECSAGYAGPLCGACESNYFKFSLWQCKNCEYESPAAVRGLVVALLLVAIVPIPFLLEKKKVWSDFALVLRIVFNYTQLMLCAVLLQVRWPAEVLLHHEVMLAIASMGSIYIYSECQFPSLSTAHFYYQLVSTVSFPGLLLIASAALSTLVSLMRKLPCKGGVSLCASLACLAAYNYLPAVALMSLSMLKCQEVAGKARLVIDTTEECWVGDHRFYVLLLATPALVFTIAAQALAMIIVWKPQKNSVLRSCKKYLTAGFRDEAKGWEVLLMLWKLVLLLLSLTFPKLDRFSHAILFSTLVGIGLQISINWHPFAAANLNHLNSVCFAAVCCLGFTAASGSDLAGTVVSCTGSAVVFVCSCLALKHSRTNRAAVYAVPDTLQEASAINSSGKLLHEYSRPPPPSLEQSLSHL